MRKTGKKILILLLDILLGAVMVLGVWGYEYLIPRAEPAEYTVSWQEPAKTGTDISDGPEKKDGTGILKGMADSTAFSDTVLSMDNVYKSPDLSIEITHETMETGVRDLSENGKHKKYGTRIAYTLADIYIRDITCLRTAFAKDTYGIGYSELLSSMADRLGSVLSVNGDSYSNNRHKDNGTIIRNGIVYRTEATDAETLVLFQDGTMEIYTPEEMDPEAVIQKGAWQSWVFGPSLLDENGKARTEFLTWDYIKESHPRTAIGYYGPGHYCLLVADGRQPGYSRGMFLEEMAAVFEKLGCQKAYNLDGGHCSFMNMEGKTISQPYRPDHEIPDGIFIMEGIL